MKTYCLFCRSGSEKYVARLLLRIDPELEPVIPRRVLQEKVKCKWRDVEHVLLPGYIFIFRETDLDQTIRNKVIDIYKILQYDPGIRELHGADLDYSMWVYNHHGRISTSKVLKEGKNIKVLDGPLLDVTGTIVRLDRHKRRAWVEFDFDGQKRLVALSAECVKAEE